MPVYGYRIFTVQLFPGRQLTPVGFHECGGHHYRSVAGDLLGQMRGQTLVDEPEPSAEREIPAPGEVVDLDASVSEDQAAAENPFAGKKALFVDVFAQDEVTVYGEVLVGTFGDHDTALSAPQPRLVEVSEDKDSDTEDPKAPAHADLKGTAPARRYRFILNAPAEGKDGLLVVEDISRGCPVDLLVRWLNRRSATKAAEALAAMPEPPKLKDRPPWWRLKHLPAVDEEHFRAMVAQGQLERVELVKHSVTAGGNRAKVALHVSAPRPEQGVVDGALGLMTEWVRDKQEQRVGRRADHATGKAQRMTKEERLVEKDRAKLRRSQSDAEAAQAIAVILGDKIQQIGFDDGWLVLDDGGRTKRVSPSRISELFTYELNRDSRPSNVAFYAAARTKALSLQTPLQLQLEWPASIDMEGEGSVQFGPGEPPAPAEGALEVPR